MEATLVVENTKIFNTKGAQVPTDYSYYLDAKGELTDIFILNTKVFSLLNIRGLPELGQQPDRLRIIYGNGGDFMEYNIKFFLLEKAKLVIQIN